MLTKEEKQRYSRQIKLTGFGEYGQEKLKSARVLIVGIGGLGCVVATYLALAGVGYICLIDHGIVELSNLNRQSLYGDQDIGRAKVDSAKERLSALNPNLQIQGLKEEIKEENAWKLLRGCDIIVDALDNLAGRYLLNEFALSKNLPLFHDAVYGYEGRVTTIIPGKTPCLKCIYHGHGTFPPAEIPVIGVVPAIIGCLQSGEVIKYILGIGQLLARRLLIYDGLSQEFFEVQTKFDPNCNVCFSVNLSAKE